MNKGEAPLNPATAVGQFRVLIGDVESVPLDPVQIGFGDYAMFSDDEIEVFLDRGGSFEEAVYYGYNSLATSAALEAKTVKDMDLSVDLTKRANELRALASMWRDKAGALSADIFETFDTVVERPKGSPELAARAVTWL